VGERRKNKDTVELEHRAALGDIQLMLARDWEEQRKKHRGSEEGKSDIEK